jgi:hypothetical protein
MTLFCTLTKSLNLTDFDGGTVLGIRSLDGPFIVRTPVDGDPLRYAVAADRLGQGALGGLRVVCLCKEKGVSRAVLLTTR